MKKNTKIYKVVEIMIFIFLFLYFIKTVSAEDSWYFTQKGEIGTTGRIESITYPTKEECLNALKNVHSSWSPSATCYLKSTNILWRYEITGTQGIPAITKDGFKTKDDCNTNRNFYIKNNPYRIKEPKNCEQYYSFLPAQNNFYDIAPKKFFEEDITFDEKYTLLAPIGEYKDININDIGGYFNTFLKTMIGIAGVLAVVMIIIGGIEWMGTDSVFGKTKSKEKITSAVLGLLIALGSYALLNTINPDLLGKRRLNIDQVNIKISSEDTSTGSSTSLCLSLTNPPNPETATGSNIELTTEITNEYIPELNKISGLSKGTKLLMTAQTAVEGFYAGTKSYRTNNPGNIGNTDDGSIKKYNTLLEGIKAQQNIITNVVTNNAKSYKVGSKPVCALGNETYNGYLYQYLRIYATGARSSNNYLNAIIGYFKANGKTITAKTTMSEIYNMN